MTAALYQVSGLRHDYGGRTVLRVESLQIRPHTIVGLMGPNGSGKSTLLKTIYGFTTVTGGAIDLLGESLLGVPSDRVGAHGLAYVPQRDNVFTSMTVRDNLRLAVRRLTKGDATRMLDEAYRLFPILAQRGDQRAGKLSGGERQMLAIALGWLARPRIMLLDEPSAGLSPLFVTEVFRTLRQLCDESGITMVVVEQNARSILRWCDYAYVLREGQVAFQGSADDILNDEETVKGYLGVG